LLMVGDGEVNWQCDVDVGGLFEVIVRQMVTKW